MIVDGAWARCQPFASWRFFLAAAGLLILIASLYCAQYPPFFWISQCPLPSCFPSPAWPSGPATASSASWRWGAVSGGAGLVALDGGGPGADAVPGSPGLARSRKLRAGFSKLAVLALLGMVLEPDLWLLRGPDLGATEIGLMMGLTP
jgi:hypothetical protein